jgi:hypothetical protein
VAAELDGSACRGLPHTAGATELGIDLDVRPSYAEWRRFDYTERWGFAVVA